MGDPFACDPRLAVVTRLGSGADRVLLERAAHFPPTQGYSAACGAISRLVLGPPMSREEAQAIIAGSQ